MRGNVDAYGIVYNIPRRKISHETVMTNIETPNQLPTWQATAAALLQTLIPTGINSPGPPTSLCMNASVRHRSIHPPLDLR